MHEGLGTWGLRRRGIGAARRAINIATFLLIAMTCVVWFGRAQAADYSFNTIRVEGLQRIERATVLAYAGIKPGEVLSEAQLNDAYQRITNSGLFQTVTFQPEGSRLVIKVKEFPTINIINFEGNRRIKADALSKVIKSQSRRVYSPSQAEQDAANIVQLYRNSKRYAVTVTPKIIPRSENRVDLVFEITEGKPTYIERLSFIGNHAFSDYRLRQVLATKQAGLLRGIFSNNSYDPQRLEQDKALLTKFYHERGYMDFRILDANAQLERGRQGFFLTFTIHEGPRYRFGKATVTSQVKEVAPTALEGDLRVKPGEVYTPLALDQSVNRMQATTTRDGLNFIRITPEVTRDRRDLRANVNFVVDRAPKVFV